MSNPWPAPHLRQRQNDLGWLALSPPEDELRVGTTGSTRQEAEASYASHRAAWQALRDARGSDLASDGEHQDGERATLPNDH